MGQVVLRRTNHETRHSVWKAWEQEWSLRIGSGSVEEVGGGWVAAGSISGEGESVVAGRSAGAGSDGP